MTTTALNPRTYLMPNFLPLFFFFPLSLSLIMTKDNLEDIRIEGYNALLTPDYVKEEFPVVNVYSYHVVNMSSPILYSLICQERQF